MGKLDGELIVKRYMDRLYQDFRVESDDEGCTLTMPYLDRHRNFIQVYITKTESGATLSDYGDTISDLRICGLAIDNHGRRQALNEQLSLFGIELDGDELRMSSSWDDSPALLHEFTQGILAIGGLIHMATAEVEERLPEEAEREILRRGLEEDQLGEKDFGTALHEIFKSTDGVDLEIPERDAMPEPPRFD